MAWQVVDMGTDYIAVAVCCIHGNSGIDCIVVGMDCVDRQVRMDCNRH